VANQNGNCANNFFGFVVVFDCRYIFLLL